MKGHSLFYFKTDHSAFTLIELLVVIAIIAILSVVVILTLNPAELLRQSRDSNRVSDMDTLTHALGIYSTDVGSSLGSSSIVYISIPDSLATSSAGDQCQGLGLPSLPSAYSYHCTNSTYSRNVDGTGWIPVNFTAISSGAPIGSLPVDPANTSSSRLYYSYATNGTTYEVTSPMESQKYKVGGSSDVITGDGGTLASVYEKGTAFGLEPLDYGYSDNSLIGYWSFEEGSSSIAYDYSGNNATGSWSGAAIGTNGRYSAGKIGNWAGAFDGATDYILNNKTINTPVATVSAWIYLTAYPTSTRRIVGFAQGNGATTFDKEILISSTGTITFYVYDGSNKITATAGEGPVALNQWTHVSGTANGTVAIAYVNGAQVGTVSAGNTYSSYAGPDILIGGSNNSGTHGYFPGLIDDVRIYNRALSAAEIQSLYNGGK